MCQVKQKIIQTDISFINTGSLHPSFLNSGFGPAQIYADALKASMSHCYAEQLNVWVQVFSHDWSSEACPHGTLDYWCAGAMLWPVFTWWGQQGVTNGIYVHMSPPDILSCNSIVQTFFTIPPPPAQLWTSSVYWDGLVLKLNSETCYKVTLFSIKLIFFADWTGGKRLLAKWKIRIFSFFSDWKWTMVNETWTNHAGLNGVFPNCNCSVTVGPGYAIN